MHAACEHDAHTCKRILGCFPIKLIPVVVAGASKRWLASMADLGVSEAMTREVWLPESEFVAACKLKHGMSKEQGKQFLTEVPASMEGSTMVYLFAKDTWHRNRSRSGILFQETVAPAPGQQNTGGESEAETLTMEPPDGEADNAVGPQSD